jgi:hypothetical protein
MELTSHLRLMPKLGMREALTCLHVVLLYKVQQLLDLRLERRTAPSLYAAEAS